MVINPWAAVRVRYACTREDCSHLNSVEQNVKKFATKRMCKQCQFRASLLD
jgi:hypothetical protein